MRISKEVKRLKKDLKKAKANIQIWKWNYKQKEREFINFKNKLKQTK